MKQVWELLPYMGYNGRIKHKVTDYHHSVWKYVTNSYNYTDNGITRTDKETKLDTSDTLQAHIAGH